MLQSTWEHIYLFTILFLFPLTIYPEVQSPDHTIDVSLIILETFNLCSLMAKPIYIPIESVQAFTFLHILTTLFSSCL